MGLAKEASDAVVVGGDGVGQDLDGDVAVEGCVERQVHVAQPARAHAVADKVPAELSSGREHCRRRDAVRALSARRRTIASAIMSYRPWATRPGQILPPPP